MHKRRFNESIYIVKRKDWKWRSDVNYLFFELGLFHGKEKLFAVRLGPLRWEQKRRRNHRRRPWILGHGSRKL